jgi:glycosyltransferase involved in cell wall biosynthesis
MKLIEKYNLLEVIQLVGQKSHAEILSYYKSVDSLLFPSQFESFGLPLLEACSFGLPIIAADLPYAAEVLEEYNNKIFIDAKSVNLWADAIKNYRTYKKCYNSRSKSVRNSWKVFFELAGNIIKSAV